MLWSSGIRWKSGTLILKRNSQKKEWISIVYYCLENRSIAHNFWTTDWSVSGGFSAKCTSPNRHLYRTPIMSHVWLQTNFPRWMAIQFGRFPIAQYIILSPLSLVYSLTLTPSHHMPSPRQHKLPLVLLYAVWETAWYFKFVAIFDSFDFIWIIKWTVRDQVCRCLRVCDKFTRASDHA